MGGAITLSPSNNMISNSGVAITAVDPGSRVWATGNTVNDNVTGFSNSGGVFESAGNNALRNNGTDVDGTVTVIATK
jgi:hypothetical protein